MSKKLIYLICFALVLNMASQASADLILHWRFDEGSGDVVNDSSGNGHVGTIEGATWVVSERGPCLEFGGDGDRVVEWNAPDYLNGLDAVTLAVWVKSNQVPTDSGFIICEEPDGGDNIITMRYDVTGANSGGTSLLKMAIVAPGDEQQLESSSNLQTTEWQHVALVWARGEQLQFYVNGELDTPSSNGLPRDVSTGDVIILIVGQGGKDWAGGWDGLIDDVRIYDNALTQVEIQAAMEGTVWPYAFGPTPADGASHPKTWVRLSWTPGPFAVSHDVYFGENLDDVSAGTGGTFRGNQTSNDFLVGLPGSPYPDGLVPDTTYYWRIDDVEADGVTKHRGTVWSFFVSYEKAYPSAVSTFHCIGIYWSPQDGSSDNVCQVHYRSYGSTDWKEALPLWYDDRGVGGYPAGYRGSIVNLEPGTTYEIELRLLNTGTTETFTASTWSEDFPIARTVYLPAGMTNQALRITESGSPDGYILYTHPEGETSTINVNNQEDSCIYVSASYIIIRGLTLREASVHGIRILNNVHDVVIEECDISGWGRLQEGEWGHDNDAAVFSDSPNIERIIVQRNKLHHPRADTNSSKESARTIPINTHHPMGPQAIVFTPRNVRAGHYVIRYNEIYSDDDHYFKDSMGESHNFSYHGFPIRDTDIYGNYIANCWDSGIQAEGADCNVRVWGNYITRTAEKIATQSVSVGPLYIWRNVFGISRVGPNDNYGWRAIKSGDVQGWGGGKTYIFHNTILQPPPPDHGSPAGVNAHDANLTNTLTRNNILHISNDRYDSICDPNRNATNDFDYDLFNGNINARPGSERNGINGVPIYDPDNDNGEFALDSSSPGYDAGVVIPNFNDNYNGAAPDIGAHEAGSPPMEFGVNAYQ